MTASVVSRASRCKPLSAPEFIGSPLDERYRRGREVVRWIEANCVYGEGDKFGQPVRLESFQARFLLQLYELKPNGTRRYRRALLEVPKGNGKTPIAAWVGAFELTHNDSAVIPVAAASYEQADLLFGDLRTCVRESPTLGNYLEAFENAVQVRDGPGRAYKVAAIAGTNDGQRPTCFLADEIHEWLGNKRRVHLVIGNGLSKRTDSLLLNTTTPGWDIESLAGEMHEHGLRVNAGEVRDDEFLFIWYGCAEDKFDLNDDDQLRQAIREANPAADKFLNVEDVASRFHQIPRYEFSRYHLGNWTSVWELWLPSGLWDSLSTGEHIPDGSDVVLAFDGSYNNDSTALVGCTVGDGQPHLDVIAVWEPPTPCPPGWTVPIVDVEEMIRAACQRFKVVEIACDPFRWARTIEILSGERLPVTEFKWTPSRSIPATERLYRAAVNHEVSHSGDSRMARHVFNATVKVGPAGSYLSKADRNSGRKDDLVVCAAMALDRAAAHFGSITPQVIDLAELLRQAAA